MDVDLENFGIRLRFLTESIQKTTERYHGNEKEALPNAATAWGLASDALTWTLVGQSGSDEGEVGSEQQDLNGCYFESPLLQCLEIAFVEPEDRSCLISREIVAGPQRVELGVIEFEGR
jgi:hypothetical protein